ncbi:MAG: MBL fold metallo-hydrolase [Phycisphaerales bacterium]
MIPRPPPREGSLGFLYLPPFRVQGYSVAGEATAISIPEMDICFDMGKPFRAHLAPKYCVLSHGHMDHIGGLAYWCSQRNFQGMGPGTIVCDKRIESDVRGMMDGFQSLERQKTPYELIALEEGDELQIKNNIYLRPFPTEHTCPSSGYTIVEKRTKLKPELAGLPQEKIKELRQRGEEIVNHFEVPQIAYTGDTLPGPHLLREDVMNAQIIITECTFFEKDHQQRAKIGMHMHVNDIAEWLKVAQCEHMVICHVSRRTHLGQARKALTDVAGKELAKKVHFLMDHRSNRDRYEVQAEEAQRIEDELANRD